MPPAPTVTVILPTFNRAGYIRDAIRSVLAQSQAPHQFIVVDDGSTDATEAAVRDSGAGVDYIRQDNAGKLAAIATGLDRATGDLIWIMDDDDIAPPDALAALAAPFAGAPDVVMSYGKLAHFDGAEPGFHEPPLPYPDDPRPFFVLLMESCFISGHPCVMVRRSALQALRPFDPGILASVDYYLHLGTARQGRVVAVDRVVLYQRQHAGLRGPEAERYGAADRFDKWIAHDARIFDRLLDALPLQAYLAPPPWTDGALDLPDHRRALLQRAVIAGRKKLWDRALADLERALALGPDLPLEPAALHVLSGLLGSPFGIPEVTRAPAIPDAIRRRVALRRDRSAILAAIARPLLQEIKTGGRRREMLSAWPRLMDLSATGAALRASAGRNMARAARRLRGA